MQGSAPFKKYQSVTLVYHKEQKPTGRALTKTKGRMGNKSLFRYLNFEEWLQSWLWRLSQWGWCKSPGGRRTWRSWELFLQRVRTEVSWQWASKEMGNGLEADGMRNLALKNLHVAPGYHFWLSCQWQIAWHWRNAKNVEIIQLEAVMGAKPPSIF